MTLNAIWQLLGVRGCLAVGFAVALAFVMWRSDTISAQRDHAEGLYHKEQAAHAVTRASVDRLEASHAAFIAEGAKRAKAAQDALRDAEKRAAALDAQIGTLRAQRPASRPHEAIAGVCETPRSVLTVEGL